MLTTLQTGFCLAPPTQKFSIRAQSHVRLCHTARSTRTSATFFCPYCGYYAIFYAHFYASWILEHFWDEIIRWFFSWLNIRLFFQVCTCTFSSHDWIEWFRKISKCFWIPFKRIIIKASTYILTKKKHRMFSI